MTNPIYCVTKSDILQVVATFRASSYELGNWPCFSVAYLTNFVVCSFDEIKIVPQSRIAVTIVALLTLFTLIIKLILILLKWNHINRQKLTLFWPLYVAKTKLFDQKSFAPRSPGLECSYRRILISSRLPRSRSPKP